MLTDHPADARTGDPGAVNAFLTACVPLVRMTAIRILGAGNDMVDDAIQESLIKVWRNLHRFDSGNIDAWIVTVASNACHDVRLSAMHRHWHGSIGLHTLRGMAASDDTAAIVCRDDDRRRVRDAIGRLSATYRDVAWLMHVEGYKVREVVQALGLSSVTAHGRARDARVALSKMLNEN